jgi:hypothetical protein
MVLSGGDIHAYGSLTKRIGRGAVLKPCAGRQVVAVNSMRREFGMTEAERGRLHKQVQRHAKHVELQAGRKLSAQGMLLCCE